MPQLKLSESDLLIYYLAVVKKYYELFELYGLFYEHSKCKKCGHDSGLHYKLLKEIIDSFSGSKKGIAVPAEEEVKKVMRDITIWRGLSRCYEGEEQASAAVRVSNDAKLVALDYAKRYNLSLDSIYKIRVTMQAMVDKFLMMKKIFSKKKAHE